MQEQIITGTVESIIYANEENGYCVFSIDCEDEEIICTGTLPQLNEGEFVTLSGNYVIHAVYGRQFNVQTYDKTVPETKEGMAKYLASGVIKGIGEKMAKRIVERFGSQTFEVIENYPEKLAQIKGITLDKAMEICQIFHEQAAQRSAMMFLHKYGIATSVASKIYKQYKEKTIEILNSNPYRLANEIDGIGFKTADSIAYRIGIASDNINRIKAGIRYVLTNSISNGHTHYPEKALAKDSAALLEAPLELVETGIKELHIDNVINVENMEEYAAVYLGSYYYAESYVGKKLLELDIAKTEEEKDYLSEIDSVCKKLEIELAAGQKDAVVQSLKGGVLVITGGPGTGKTTTINTIINILESQGNEIELAAPTGRAAKRMTEATGIEAKTIHRLLGVKFISEDVRRQVFEKNEENPIKADVIIIDEISMVDIMLMMHLLKAVEIGTRLILVGDSDQLPSVGAGNVLKDIISSQTLNVVYLNEIFRQASMSDIVVNAHKINKGEYPALNNKDSDFFMVKRENIDGVAFTITDLVKNRLPKFGDFDCIKDIQVLSPMRKSKIGVINLNSELQKVLNPPRSNKKEHEFRDFVFREGDKVMQIKNNYNLRWETRVQGSFATDEGNGVFNGDEGIIESISILGEKLTVIFDGNRRVEYDFSQLDELEPAYAVTIHKSQGSEYKVVVIPVHSGPSMLLSRNLLYTAVTRAKKLVVLVGTEECLKNMVDNDKEVLRYSALDKRLIKFHKFYRGI